MKPYPLFRVLYIRQHRICGMTFAARNAAFAAEIAYTAIDRWIKSIDPRCEVLDVVPVKNRK